MMWNFFYKRPTIHYGQRKQQTHRDTDRHTETQRQQYLVNGETTIREYSSFSTIIFRFSHCFSPVCVCKGGGRGRRVVGYRRAAWIYKASGARRHSRSLAN